MLGIFAFNLFFVGIGSGNKTCFRIIPQMYGFYFLPVGIQTRLNKSSKTATFFMLAKS
jgi:hypothetical protein